MSEVRTKEDLLVNQKKEKKELLARTQKMKHSVPKGDKKKKKEVNAEIAILLADLDLKHENELKEFDDLSKEEETTTDNKIEKEAEKGAENKDKIEIENIVADENSIKDSVEKEKDSAKAAPRLSKAQKRRNKKAMLEKERNKAIAEQESENLNSLRHLESEEIKRKLSERNLTIFEVPSDGNCLYKAVEHQLSFLKLKETTVQLLREETAKCMLENMNDYLPFLTSPETGDVLTEDQYVKYCEDIAKTPAWGGHIEVQVLSRVCGFPIEVIQSEGPSILAGDENSNPRLILSYHRYAYGLGEHFNSVVPVTE